MLQFLHIRRHASVPAIVALAVDPADVAQAEAPVVERHCAWFDSSRELKAGLSVQELPFCREDWLALSGRLQ